MGANWAKDLPRVSVPTRDTPKPVTLIYPYYENPEFFGHQLLRWFGRIREFDAALRVIVVDDGSPDYPAIDVVWRSGSDVLAGGRLRLFRIDVDVPWNWLAARNIGAHHAADGWLLLTDMDHVVPESTLRAVIYGDHHPDVIYTFSRIEHDGVHIHPHSASFLLTRAMFWRVGGYDETLAGHYGSDGDWRRRCAKVAPVQVLGAHLERHESVSDASTKRYVRKRPADSAAIRQLTAARDAAHRLPKVLSFPYHEVAVCSPS